MICNKRMILGLLLVGLLLPSMAFSAPKISLTLSGVYSKAFPQVDASLPDDMRTGIGGHGLLEMRFSRGLALGFGSGLITYKGDSGFGVTHAVDALGRLIPIASEKAEVYLIGGVGYNTLRYERADIWPGRYHGTAGLGTRLYLVDSLGFDLAAVYSVYSPRNMKLNSADVRLGISLGMGRLGAKSTPAPTPVATAETIAVATPVVDAEPSAEEGIQVVKPVAKEITVTGSSEIAEGSMKTYSVRTKDSLWNIAWKKDVYNDPELYPILLRANKDRVNPDGTVDAGTKLVIPEGLTAQQKKDAKSDSWSKKYVGYRGRVVNYTRYKKYVELQKLIKKYGARKYRVKKGENLWTLAGREDFYLDNWKFVDIYHANLMRMSNPDILAEGQILLVPNIPVKKGVKVPKALEGGEVVAPEPTAVPTAVLVEPTAVPTVASEPVFDDSAKPVPTPTKNSF